jgi:DNA (cytosine-5)-methyltransferase 1
MPLRASLEIRPTLAYTLSMLELGVDQKKLSPVSLDIKGWLRSTSAPEWTAGNRAIHVADLFSGCGGMTLGAAWAIHRLGFVPSIELTVDIDHDCLAVYERNLGDVSSWIRQDSMDRVFQRNIDAALSGPERYLRRCLSRIDVLLAGPPCQGHSDLNNRTRRTDPRNALYLQAVRAIRVLEPSIAIIENVPTVVHDKGGVVGHAHAVLESLGYHISGTVIDASLVGVAQRRRRHFLLVTRQPHDCVLTSLQNLPQSRRLPTVRDAISDLQATSSQDGHLPDRPSRMTPENFARAQWLYSHDEYDLPDTLRPACHADGNHSYRSVYGRLKWNEPAQTITTGFGSMGQGRYLHPSACRTITPHEAARLQGFPDFFSFDGIQRRTSLQRLIGNAVPPPVAATLVDILLRSNVLH